MKKMNISLRKINYKNESGITLVSLVVMIILMLILAVVSIYAGSTSMINIIERQEQSVLNMVQEIVIAQYSKAAYAGHTGIRLIDTAFQPTSFYGECILTEDAYIDVPDDRPDAFPTAAEYLAYIAEPERTYEECYYRLGAAELKALGIEDNTENNDSVHSYIVNYSTGEVYDETLNEIKYYVKGNRAIEDKVIKIDNVVETTNFDD